MSTDKFCFSTSVHLCYFTNSVYILFSDYTKYVVILMFLFVLLVSSPPSIFKMSYCILNTRVEQT